MEKVLSEVVSDLSVHLPGSAGDVDPVRRLAPLHLLLVLLVLDDPGRSEGHAQAGGWRVTGPSLSAGLSLMCPQYQHLTLC